MVEIQHRPASLEPYLCLSVLFICLAWWFAARLNHTLQHELWPQSLRYPRCYNIPPKPQTSLALDIRYPPKRRTLVVVDDQQWPLQCPGVGGSTIHYTHQQGVRSLSECWTPRQAPDFGDHNRLTHYFVISGCPVPVYRICTTQSADTLHIFSCQSRHILAMAGQQAVRTEEGMTHAARAAC